ncbi:MAG: hypothetical protein AAGI38_18265 [Bacteroidota bacterium]
MERRDILMDQIEQFSRALGTILARFMGLKEDQNTQAAMAVVHQDLQTELNVDMEQLTRLEGKELTEYIGTLKLTAEHLDHLAKYLYEVGTLMKQEEQDQLAQLYFAAAKRLLDRAFEQSTTIPFDRIYLKEKLEKELKKGL